MSVFGRDLSMMLMRKVLLLAALLYPQFVQAAPLPAVGSAAPEFSLKDQNGKI